MFSLINITIFTLWFVSALADYLDFTHIWQLKEYRWDRFRDFMSTEQGRLYRLKYNLFGRSALAIIFFFWPINQIVFIKYIIILFFFGDILYLIFKILKKKLFLPKFTHKAILIIGLAILAEGLLFILKHDWSILFILLVARFFLIAGIIYLINIPTKWLKYYLIKKATNKISTYKNLLIIGITGSYGKTTTKTFLHHILSKKFSVVSTPEHVNTEIGVTKFILNTDFSDKEIFIVEMGAYTMGEVKAICDIVKPKIGILTAINEQHLSLFGNIKNTQKAKYELLKSLPEDGLAITNSDNAYCREFLDTLKSKILTFGTEEEWKPACLITDLKSTPNGTYCAGIINGQKKEIETPLRGEHNALNVAPCILIARYLNIAEEHIVEAIKTLPQTYNFYEYGNCSIIDDSYNSNPEGFKVALSLFNNFKSERHRVVITRGMLELGEKSSELHEQIAGEIAFSADELIIITPDSEEAFRHGACGLKYKLDIKTIFEPTELLKHIISLKNTKAVILLENRIPSIVMNEIKNNSL